MATGGPQVHDRSGKQLICDLCDTKVDTCLYKCVDCDVYMCNNCTRAHNRVKSTRDHKIIKDQHGPLPTSRSNSSCNFHPGEEVTFYCHTCVIFICTFCITSNHSDHKCSVIKHASEEMSADLTHRLNSLKDNHVTVLRSQVEQLENLQKENEEQHDLTVKNIKARGEELVYEINKIQTKLIQESEKTTNQNKSRLSELRDNVVKKAEESEKVYNDFSKVLTSGSDIDKIMARNEVVKVLEQYQSHVQDEEIHYSKFVLGDTDITTLERSFGLIEVSKGETSNANFFKTQSVKDVSTPEIPTAEPVKDGSVPEFSSPEPFKEMPQDKEADKDGSSSGSNTQGAHKDIAVTMDTQTNKTSGPESKDRPSRSPDINVNIISTFKHKSTRVRSICPVSDNTAFIYSRGEQSIDQVDSSGHILGTIKLDFDVYDFVMPVLDCSFICTDGNSKNIYKVTSEGHNTQVIYTGPLDPYCLCLTSDGHILVTMADDWTYDVNNDSKRIVTRMTTTGQTLTTFEYNKGIKLFTLPYGIDENINRDICVVNKTSTVSGHIVILNASGELKCTYKGQGSEKFDPFRVKCDKSGHIFVSDWNNKKIHMLNSDGQFVQYLMTEKEFTQNPLSLAIVTRGLLWVGCFDGEVYVLKYMYSESL